MNRIIEYLKKEIVLSIATILAVVSMFFVTPDIKYIEYIDYRTLGILFSLMVVMEGFKEVNLFQMLAQKMLLNVKNTWQLVFILTMLCFFFSMFITNDVALITFVPLTIIILNILDDEKKHKLIIPTVAIQTVAANLGSMLTPIGNPQNLYLYGRANMEILEFITLMLPYTIVSFLVVTIWTLLVAGGKNKENIEIVVSDTKIESTRKLIIYIALFVLCLLTVVRIISFEKLLIIVIFTIIIVDKKILKGVDYGLLLTFIAFFIFIGNMGRIDGFRIFLENIIEGNEMLTAVISSQIISNVPAALLLSGFTDNYKSLIIGTNLGGLGTLIASMASLISFKYVAKENSKIKGKYIGYFTFANIIILVVLLLFEILW